MVAIPFDALTLTQKLTDIGMPREQAEKFSEIQKDVFKEQHQHLQENLDKTISTQLATKEDISEVKKDISSLKHDVNIKTLKLDKKIDLLRKEFEGKFHLLYWMSGTTLAFCISIVFKLFFFQ